MSFTLFLISLLGLCIASIIAFVVALRKQVLLLIVFVPLIALCGSSLYFSYEEALGYPVQMKWKDLDEEFTVIFFKVEVSESITLWLLKGETTRLIDLPYRKDAEDGLERQRLKMGQGIPATFSSKNKGEGKGKGEGNKKGADATGEKGKVKAGWKYKLKSHGKPISSGKMPPK